MSTLSALHGVGAVLYGRIFVTLPIPTGGPELAQQTMIVTGANTGLGFESTRHLSNLGVGKVIMAVRTISKGEEAKKRVIAATGRPEASIEVWPLDMDSYDSIKQFANRASQLPRLDGVLANAGIMTTKFNLSEGRESTLNINVISTFLLYMLLLPKMRDSKEKTGNPCRFVVPNSALHYLAATTELNSREKGLMERLSDPEKADMAARYNVSKLVVLYIVREFAERAKASVIVNTPNPSYCKSNLTHEQANSPGFKTGEKLLARSTEEGSRALVGGLLAGKESNGQYLNNCHVQSPARFVTSKWGKETQQYIFQELLDTLEKIQPGILSNL